MKLRRAEIKEYSEDDIPHVITNPRYISELPDGTLPNTFVRRVRVCSPRFSLSTLERLLAIADHEFENVADLCGAEVIPHTWGILPNARNMTSKSRRIPNGRSPVVVEVDRIIENTALQETYDLQTVYKGLKRYNRHSWARKKLDDMKSPYQFMLGANANDVSRQRAALFLIDIEPIFRPELVPFF